MVSRFEKFSFLIGELSKLLHKIEGEELQPLGLKGPYAIYILTIAKSTDGITATALCEACGRDKADVSRAISALLDGGFAEKIITEGKKYKATYKLTQKGLDVANNLRSNAENAVDFASNGVSDNDRKIFYDTLETIYLNMRKMSDFGVLHIDD